MGRRSGTETAIAVLAAFIGKNTWEQASLARRVGVTSRTLRVCLDDLVRHGVPLERFDESQREIWWSVRKGWLPDAAPLGADDVRDCARLLARLPASDVRDRLVERLVGASALELARREREAAPKILSVLEDARRDRAAVSLLYDSANSGLRWRVVSPHHLAHGDRPRLIATCHERRALGWFRVDRVLRAERSDDSFRAAAPAELASFRDRSASGFHRGEPVVVGFRVRAPEAKWVRGVLPLEGASVRELDSGGIEIEAETAGLEVVARFVAGLGDAAVALTPALRARVREIAAGALRVNAELRKGQVVAEEGEARVSGGGGGQ